MRTIAKAGPYRVVQEMNGLVRLYRLDAVVATSDSAYALIRAVEDHSIRSQLLEGWKADIATQDRAEKSSREAEFHG